MNPHHQRRTQSPFAPQPMTGATSFSMPTAATTSSFNNSSPAPFARSSSIPIVHQNGVIASPYQSPVMNRQGFVAPNACHSPAAFRGMVNSNSNTTTSNALVGGLVGTNEYHSRQQYHQHHHQQQHQQFSNSPLPSYQQSYQVQQQQQQQQEADEAIEIQTTAQELTKRLETFYHSLRQLQKDFDGILYHLLTVSTGPSCFAEWEQLGRCLKDQLALYESNPDIVEWMSNFPDISSQYNLVSSNSMKIDELALVSSRFLTKLMHTIEQQKRVSQQHRQSTQTTPRQLASSQPQTPSYQNMIQQSPHSASSTVTMQQYGMTPQVPAQTPNLSWGFSSMSLATPIVNANTNATANMNMNMNANLYTNLQQPTTLPATTSHYQDRQLQLQHSQIPASMPSTTSSTPVSTSFSFSMYNQSSFSQSQRETNQSTDMDVDIDKENNPSSSRTVLTPPRNRSTTSASASASTTTTTTSTTANNNNNNNTNRFKVPTTPTAKPPASYTNGRENDSTHPDYLPQTFLTNFLRDPTSNSSETFYTLSSKPLRGKLSRLITSNTPNDTKRTYQQELGRVYIYPLFDRKRHVARIFFQKEFSDYITLGVAIDPVMPGNKNHVDFKAEKVQKRGASTAKSNQKDILFSGRLFVYQNKWLNGDVNDEVPTGSFVLKFAYPDGVNFFLQAMEGLKGRVVGHQVLQQASSSSSSSSSSRRSSNNMVGGLVG